MKALRWKNHFRKWNGRSAFTLYEVLTIIVIIAVLAILLIPAWQSAVRQAGRTGCMNNLRQITAASLLWANDHDGFLPSGSDNPYPPPYSIVPRYSVYYIYAINSPLGDTLLTYLNNDPSVFFCPGNDKSFYNAWLTQPWGWGDGGTLYIYYGFLNDVPSLYPLSPTKVSDPPRSFLWGDLAALSGSASGPVFEYPTGFYWSNHPGANHAILGENWARLDGSVEWLPLSQLKVVSGLPGVIPQYYLPAELFSN